MGARFFKLESLQLDLMRRCHKGMDEKRMMGTEKNESNEYVGSSG